MDRGKAYRRGTLRKRVQSRRDSARLWRRVHLPLGRSTLRTLAQARLHQSARSIRRPRAPSATLRTWDPALFWCRPGHVFSVTEDGPLCGTDGGSLSPREDTLGALLGINEEFRCDWSEIWNSLISESCRWGGIES